MHFPVAGIDTSPLVPVLVAFGLSSLGSMAGMTGAFVLLPFQVSVLGFTGPAVTPTNHLFNAIGIPSGVYRYVREKRMVWPIALLMVAGIVPGVVAGSLARIYLLPDPVRFKLYAGLVLLFIAGRSLQKALADRHPQAPKESAAAGRERPADAGPDSFRCRTVRFDWRRLEYEFQGQRYGLSPLGLGALSSAVGVIGGAYGIGGGALLAPILVGLYKLPVHTIAGATLFGTCLSSLVAVALFSVASAVLGTPSVSPDWLLGLLFGLGGLAGTFVGAGLQKRVRGRWIEAVLGVIVSALAISYIVGFIRA